MSTDGDSYVQGVITDSRLTFIEFYQALHSRGDFGLYDLTKKSDSDDESFWTGRHIGSKDRDGGINVEFRVMGRSLELRKIRPINSDSFNLCIPYHPLTAFWRWMEFEGLGYANPHKKNEENNSDLPKNTDDDLPF